jgi:hypothetical protein
MGVNTMNFNKIIVLLAFFSAFIGTKNVFSMNVPSSSTSIGVSSVPTGIRPAPLVTPPNSPSVTPKNSPTAVKRRMAHNLITPSNPRGCGIIGSPSGAQGASPVVRTGKIPVSGLSRVAFERVTKKGSSSKPISDVNRVLDFNSASSDDIAEYAQEIDTYIKNLSGDNVADKNFESLQQSLKKFYDSLCLTGDFKDASKEGLRLCDCSYEQLIHDVIVSLKGISLPNLKDKVKPWILRFQQLTLINTVHISRLFFYEDAQGNRAVGGGHMFDENQQNESDEVDSHLSIGGLKILATDCNANVSYGYWLYTAQHTDANGQNSTISDIKYSSFFPRDWDENKVLKHLEKIINGISYASDKDVEVIATSVRHQNDQLSRKTFTVLYTYYSDAVASTGKDCNSVLSVKKMIVEVRCDVDKANDRAIKKLLTAFPIATCYDICDFPLTKKQETLNDRLKRIKFEVNNTFVSSVQGEIQRKKVDYTLKEIVAEAFECVQCEKKKRPIGVEIVDLGTCAEKSHANAEKSHTKFGKTECNKQLVLFDEKSTRVAIPIAIIVHYAQTNKKYSFYGPVIGNSAQLSYADSGTHPLQACYMQNGVIWQKMRNLYKTIQKLSATVNDLLLPNALSNQKVLDLVMTSQELAVLLSSFEKKNDGIVCTNFQDIKKQLSEVRDQLKDKVYQQMLFTDDKLKNVKDYREARAFLSRWQSALNVVLRQIVSKMYNDFGMKFILETIG